MDEQLAQRHPRFEGNSEHLRHFMMLAESQSQGREEESTWICDSVERAKFLSSCASGQRQTLA